MIKTISDFINPVKTDYYNLPDYKGKDLLFSEVNFYNPKKSEELPKKIDIAIIGISEDRNSSHPGSSYAPAEIRKELYKLYASSKINIVDFGNIKNGKTVKDTYFAITEVIYELLKKEIIVIVLGGSKDLFFPICNAYEKGSKNFSLCVAEPKFSLKQEGEVFNDTNYLTEIIEKNTKLFNYTNLGYQTYYNSSSSINYIHQKYEALRLGLSRTDLRVNEPYIRDADIFGIDLAAIKKTDAPGVIPCSIHGYYGEEICQLAKYAGLSDRTSVLGIFNLNPTVDINNQTAELSAQIIWHVIQGIAYRTNEIPCNTSDKFRRYIVKVSGINQNINFIKSLKTGRWWYEIIHKTKKEEKYKYISCSFEDYIKASGDEIPERWWKFYKKLFL
jgi:arginase family enzyme